ncbi:MAG: hypothetical protein ACOC93_03520 [Planctomycetota bacterium]
MTNRQGRYMTQTTAGQSPNAGKGKAFFDRADQVAETGNYDFAVELYIEGLKREPEALERGHRPLREVAMKRAIKGGKPAGMVEKFKHGSSKDPVTALTNAEYLLAKEPGNVQLMTQVLKAARKLGDPAVIEWICDLLFETQRQAAGQKKGPNRNVLNMLMDSYEQAQQYGKAISAGQMMLQQTPNDGALQERIGDLGAQQTLQKGGYGETREDTSKIHGIRDESKQKELLERDSIMQSKNYLEQQIERARAEYIADPTVPGKVNAYVDTLLKAGGKDNEDEAMEVLRKAYDETGAYQFKMRMADIKMQQMDQRRNELLQAGKKKQAAQLARAQLEYEIEEYAERVVNYPTDLQLKFELGRRQFHASSFDPEKLDDAISSLQKSRSDPRRRVAALLYLGQAFSKKEWYDEAIDSYRQALEQNLNEQREKEVRYWLGDAYKKKADTQEQMDDLRNAEEQFSRVAQMEYDYKDARDRLDEVRKQIQAWREHEKEE